MIYLCPTQACKIRNWAHSLQRLFSLNSLYESGPQSGSLPLLLFDTRKLFTPEHNMISIFRSETWFWSFSRTTEKNIRILCLLRICPLKMLKIDAKCKILTSIIQEKSITKGGKLRLNRLHRGPRPLTIVLPSSNLGLWAPLTTIVHPVNIYSHQFEKCRIVIGELFSTATVLGSTQGIG